MAYAPEMGSVAPIAAGVVLLPETGNSKTIMIIAASLIALGVGVLVVSWVLSHKKRNTEVL